MSIELRAAYERIEELTAALHKVRDDLEEETPGLFESTLAVIEDVIADKTVLA